MKLEGINIAVQEDGITEGVGVKQPSNKCYKHSDGIKSGKRYLR